MGLRYNSRNDTRPTLSVGYAESLLNRDANNVVSYTGPDGATYRFTPTGTSYAGTNAAGGAATLFRYTQPSGASADLVKVGSGAVVGAAFCASGVGTAVCIVGAVGFGGTVGLSGGALGSGFSDEEADGSNWAEWAGFGAIGGLGGGIASSVFR